MYSALCHQHCCGNLSLGREGIGVLFHLDAKLRVESRLVWRLLMFLLTSTLLKLD